MYEKHFGLNKRPFRALAAGTDVFVGPQTAATMAGLKKALAAPDTIVAISGPVGVGKTTLVRRALDAISANNIIISVGRMQLGHDEVLELVLEELGEQLATGTVQRFTRFRRLLKEHADKGTRVFVVVEDAVRAGADALSELEALTASDAGVSDGANVVLMGGADIDKVLKTPKLARLTQRLRLRQKISPFGVGELTGYLKHCFRLAGQEFDTIFEPGTAEVLHALSDGIPRMANNIVESVLTSAAETKQDRIGVALIKLVATEEYGLELGQETAGIAPQAAEAPIVEPAAVAKAPAAVPPAIEPAPIVAPPPKAEAPAIAKAPIVTAPELPQRIEVAPVVEPQTDQIEPPAPDEIPDTDNSIPELIQDTLPDLAILAPHLANPAVLELSEKLDRLERDGTTDLPNDNVPTLTSSADAHSTPVAKPEPDPQAELAAALEAAQVGMPTEEIPEWERDPTLAELRPDLDALEHAMLVAQGLAPAPDTGDEPVAGVAAEKDEPVPEITLDREIQAKIEEATELLKVAERDVAEPSEESESLDSLSSDKPTAEILAAAKIKTQKSKPAQPSVEDQFESADLPMIPTAKAPPATAKAPPAAAKAPPAAAKTPAAAAKAIPAVPVAKETPANIDSPKEDSPQQENPQLNQIAADLARAKTLDDVDDQMAETLFGEEFSLIAAQVAANAPPELSADNEIELSLEQTANVQVVDVESSDPVETNVEAEKPAPPVAPIDLASTQQRLETVRALNGAPTLAPFVRENIVMKDDSLPDPAPVPDDHPETIEEQINTSITQTLKALNVRPPTANNDDDDDDDSKGGFFSRFRRS